MIVPKLTPAQRCLMGAASGSRGLESEAVPHNCIDDLATLASAGLMTCSRRRWTLTSAGRAALEGAS